MIITLRKIEAKRVEVRGHYLAHGFKSEQYNTSFAELHDMNMLFMADQFRHERGLNDNAKTPYCE